MGGDKISTILKAAKLTTVEPFWPGLFAKALGACDVKALITTIGSGVGSGPAAGAAPAAGGAAPAAAEEKKEEKKEEPAEDSDSSTKLQLFLIEVVASLFTSRVPAAQQ